MNKLAKLRIQKVELKSQEISDWTISAEKKRDIWENRYKTKDKR